MIEESLQAAIRSHVKECVFKVYDSQILRDAVGSSALMDQMCIDDEKLTACLINHPTAMSVITHEHDSLYASVFYQTIRQAAAVRMIDPDNCDVGLTPVIDVIEDIIGDGLYRFMQYCMAKCEKVMSLEGESNRYLPRRDQVKLFRFLSLYGCQTPDLEVDLRGTKQVMV